MTKQLLFKNLFRGKPAAPTSSEVAQLIEWLDLHPGFHTAKEIQRWTGFDDRMIREITEHANGEIVSGPGSPGYCHVRHCPEDLIRRTVAALRSQSERMLKKADRIDLQASLIQPQPQH